MKSPSRNNPVITAKMIEELQKTSHSYDSLSAAVGLSKVAVATWIKAMRQAGMVHISAWTDDKRGRKFTPMYSWGNRVDLARAGQARTAAERMRAYRARMKEGGTA
jgi:biotin operon repressor